MFGSHCAMSPGARTIPAAIVLPTAAEIPNHMPRTFSRRPRPRGAARASKVLLDAEALAVEDRSGRLGNRGVSGTLGTSLANFAMIMGVRENASWKCKVHGSRGRECQGNEDV